MPKINLPAIRLPDITFGDARLGAMKLPDVDLRDRLPDVDLSDLHMPHALHDVSLRDIKRDIKREAKAHHLHLPDVNLPDLDMDDVRALARLGRPVPRTRTPWAWITVAGLAGLSAGWWLSTSSITGPKMRAFADRARRRIAAWRGGGNGWDDATEERSRGFWSSEHGWRDNAAGSESSGGHGAGERQAVGTPGSTTASIDDAHPVATTDAPIATRRT